MSRRLQVYEAEEVTVTFDRDLCIHAEECVRGLPEVFDPTRRRWIQPQRASGEAVRAVVANVPRARCECRPHRARLPLTRRSP